MEHSVQLVVGVVCEPERIPPHAPLGQNQFENRLGFDDGSVTIYELFIYCDAGGWRLGMSAVM